MWIAIIVSVAFILMIVITSAITKYREMLVCVLLVFAVFPLTYFPLVGSANQKLEMSSNYSIGIEGQNIYFDEYKIEGNNLYVDEYYWVDEWGFPMASIKKCSLPLEIENPPSVHDLREPKILKGELWCGE